MPGVTDSRRIAADLCADLRSGKLLDAAFEARVSPLDARDRRWTQELVYGMLRQRSILDAYLSERVRGGLARLDPDLGDLLRLGAYQLLSMRSVPAYAAIAQTVELAKQRHGIGASKLANAVLRRVDRERDALTLPDAHRSRGRARASALASAMARRALGRALGCGRDGAAARSRTTRSRRSCCARTASCASSSKRCSRTRAWRLPRARSLRDSIQLPHGISLTELGAFRKGLFFVQDPASTLVTQYADIPPDSRVADLCAAPGGKTLELSRTALDRRRRRSDLHRTQRLIENLRRVEARNISSIVMDARHPAVREMDAVLIDVPCTGTGTLRRHPDARWRLRISDLAVMAALQRSILRAAAPS